MMSCGRQYGKKRIEINIVCCIFVADFIHISSKRKIINHQVVGGTGESHMHPHAQDLHIHDSKPHRGLQKLDTRMGLPSPSSNLVIDSINPI